MASRARLCLRAAAVVSGVCATIGPAIAQEQPVARAGLVITPSLSISETLTDHHPNSAGCSGFESITTITPGIRVNSRSGRVQGHVDYGLTGVVYARDSEQRSVQNRLSAAVRAELLPDRLDVNLNGNIFRQPVSAFGRQTDQGTATDVNQAEVRSLSVTPTLRGVLGGVVAVRASARASKTDSIFNIGSTTHGASLGLSSVGAARLGWSLDASRQISRFNGGRETTTDGLVASAIFTPDPEWRFTLRGGQERTDIAAAQQQSYDNYGAGLLWTPGPRTRVAADLDRRYFGNAHALSFEHRMRRTVWRYSDTRSVIDERGQTGGAGVNAYDLFFQLFASQEPDPALRDTLVRTFLERNGLSPDTLIGGGFLTSAVSIQRRQELSVAVQAPRTTYMLAGFATDSRRADTESNAPDDLLAGNVRQRGLTFTVSHRLTPRDSLSVTANLVRTNADAAQVRNKLTSLAATWYTQLSDRSRFSLGVRHSEFDADVDPYTENALTAAYVTRF